MFWPWKRKQAKPLTAAIPELGEPRASLLSDVGCRRELNEDSARIARVGNGKHGARGLLAVVADGMGGHQAGEVASQTAVETIESEYREAQGTPGEALEEAFRKAHGRIFQMAKENVAMLGMGTTCTALAIVGAQAWAAHVGDSRLYLVRGEEIYQLSEDHTQCMELVRKGLMTLEQARHHQDRNVLIRAMGTKQELAMMTWPGPMAVKPGDSFMLCSDGLHDLIMDGEIREVVRGSTPQNACKKLVKMAKERGGHDNITLAVVTIPAGSEHSENLKETKQYEVNG
jgi:serine/threonine protein phosphatase PrpC